MTDTLFADDRPAVPAVTQPVALTPLAIYQRAAEANVSPDMLKEMAALCERWEANQAADAYGAALTKFQALCPQITKRRKINLGGGDGPLYASSDDIMEVIQPILAQCGLAVTFSAGLTDGGQLTAKCLVRHGRHTEVSEVTLPVPSQMRVNATQQAGAALSYAKRYALCAALNIIVTDEDIDAHGLCDTVSEEQIVTLRELVESTNADESKFLKWIGVARFADIPLKKYQDALYQLQRKAKHK